jgi:predicted kinase
VVGSGDNTVLILTGPPGTGKTTAAGLLADRREPSVHLEADAFFHFIRAGRVEPWKQESREQNRVVMGIVARAAAGYAVAGYFTIVEGIVIPGWFFEPLRDALRDAGLRVAYAVLRAPLADCLARVQSREGRPPIDDAAIGQVWGSFAALGELESHVLEVEGRAAMETVAALENRLADGSLRV